MLLFLAIRGVFRLVRAATRGEPRDAPLVSEEAQVIGGFGTLAYIVGFYAPSLSVYNYTWLLVVGLAPAIGRARLADRERGVGSMQAYARDLGWLSLGGLLVLSQTNTMKPFVAFARQQRVLVGQVTMATYEADELKATLALGHSVGRGVVMAVGQ